MHVTWRRLINGLQVHSRRFRLQPIRTMADGKRQTQFQLHPATSCFSGTVSFPGEVSFRSLDLQTGLLTSHAIFRLTLRGRMIALWLQPEPNPLVDYQTLIEQYFMFVASGTVTIPRSFYNPTIPKQPAVAETILTTFRKSSLVLETSLALSDFPEKASVSTSLVLVSKATRKPAALPEWWREKYSKFSSEKSVSYLKAFDRPNQLICRGVKSKPYNLPVHRRDMDEYNHTNVSSYLQYCLDALEHHLYTNHIDCDINTVSLLLKNFVYLHRGESEVGDILTVAFWDDVSDPETVAFDISKAGKSIYQAKMQFYDKSVLQTTQSKL